jgi:hypothetical protein
MAVVVDEEMEATSLEEVRVVDSRKQCKGFHLYLFDSYSQVVEALPDFQPRFLIYSFVHEHADGRQSFPMVYIYYCPIGAFSYAFEFRYLL